MAVPGPRLPATLTEGRPPYDAAYHHHSAARLKLRPTPHFRNSDRTSPAPPSAHLSSFKISTAFSQPHLRPISVHSKNQPHLRHSKVQQHLRPSPSVQRYGRHLHPFRLPQLTAFSRQFAVH
ncbi:PAP/OAS1 substrate-binding domain superfamily [Striga asiatica]|uniref:PAP/OAS1 substrate-binding domain superfamily n=1 Tax=Striga asiatica TaxID=4170 RepID=A0A5A7Q561_STRAF|nr:PAP/OAS1 substrate-binding domain superfamily [Striga asiatica]